MIKTRGVIYFNSGTKCILRLAVSIHSLRKYYKGPITIFSDDDESTLILNNLFTGKKHILIEQINFPIHLEGKNSVYLKKTSLNKYTCYDINVFLDADTIVRSNIDELFDLANEYDFVVPQFCNWTTNTRSIEKRINSWSSYYPELISEALQFGKAVNCGVFAFSKDSDFMKNWCDSIIPGRNNFIPDETGMQVLLHKYKHHVCDQKFNVSCKYSNPHDDDAVIVHYHGRKHCRLDNKGCILYGGDLWIEEYMEAKIFNTDIESRDRMFKKWKEFKPVEQIVDKRITIVTAVNPPYLEKLKLVLPTWQIKPQLKDCELIVIHNGFDDINDLNFIEKVTGRKVTLVNWDMPEYESTRELMLTSFVMLAPTFVKTPYWLKLDADAYFSNDKDLILDHFYNYDLAGHKWKYTKSPNKSSWLHMLDEWAEDKDIAGNCYLNNKQIEESYKQKRYGHRRIASYICLHKTEFSRDIASYVDERLPIPSHDTFAWYMAQRLPEYKWCWHNMKSLGCNNNTNYDALKEIINEIQQRRND